MKVVKTPDYEGSDQRNGNGYVLKIIFGVLLTGGMGWLTSVNASQIKTEGRLATLEAQVPSIAKGVDEIKDAQDAFISRYEVDQRELRKSLEQIARDR